MGGLLVFVLLLAGVALLIGTPLLRPRPAPSADIRREHQRDRLLFYYERVLTNLRDLEEDHATGKISDADYEADREIWMLRGVESLKAVDSLQEGSLIPQDGGDTATIDEAIDAAIESAVAAYRGSQS
jgi:hypothetical protein